MASLPNLSTLRSGRRNPRSRRGGRVIPENDDQQEANEASIERARDQIVQQTDHDATSSRMSAVKLGYLRDSFASLLFTSDHPAPKRYPIINRGTYVRTTAIDHLVTRFLSSHPKQPKQIVSLGAGSDTRFFRLMSDSDSCPSQLTYHELDFESNANQKRAAIYSCTPLTNLLHRAEQHHSQYHLHALDLRHLTLKSPPSIPSLHPDVPTLILSECCLCYLAPELASSVTTYFSMTLRGPLALVLYEPVRPFDAFGRTMVANLASRGIHLQTLGQYATLQAQRERLRLAGCTTGQGARDVLQIWEQGEPWMGSGERDRIERIEWLDEVEEWRLLASHYVVAWGWRGDGLSACLEGLEGGRTAAEDGDVQAL